MKTINVTKTYLPPLAEYTKKLRDIWESGWVTNEGKLVTELENKLQKYLGVKHVIYVANGTVALQLVIRALDLEGEMITTPFSYVATTTAILWERCRPVFADIDERNFCLDAGKIEKAITARTTAILPVHVFGQPCDVEKIEKVARRHSLKVIYDGAHAFGVKFKGTSIFNYGDASVASFHATKLFHTIEGGAVITNNGRLANKIRLMRIFGHWGENNYYFVGINAKNSEVHAAMGLCTLPRVNGFIRERKRLHKLYQYLLRNTMLKFIEIAGNVDYNYSYFPVVFPTKRKMLAVRKRLNAKGIFPRRYFYPSLNTLPYLQEGVSCPISEKIADTIVCLPLYEGLSENIVRNISKTILAAL